MSSRSLVLGCAAFGVLTVALGGCAKNTAGAGATPSPSPTAMVSFLGVHYPSQGHQHFAEGASTEFAYNSDPPTSGPHKEAFSEAFNSPTPLPKYVQVHLLEHGNVLLQYGCNCPDIAGALSQIAYGYDAKLIPAERLQPMPSDVQAAEESGVAVIVAPYPGMKHKIALTAWTRFGSLDAIDQAKIQAFINAYLHNAQNLAQ